MRQFHQANNFTFPRKLKNVTDCTLENIYSIFDIGSDVHKYPYTIFTHKLMKKPRLADVTLNVAP